MHAAAAKTAPAGAPAHPSLFADEQNRLVLDVIKQLLDRTLAELCLMATHERLDNPALLQAFASTKQPDAVRRFQTGVHALERALRPSSTTHRDLMAAEEERATKHMPNFTDFYRYLVQSYVHELCRTQPSQCLTLNLPHPRDFLNAVFLRFLRHADVQTCRYVTQFSVVAQKQVVADAIRDILRRIAAKSVGGVTSNAEEEEEDLMAVAATGSVSQPLTADRLQQHEQQFAEQPPSAPPSRHDEDTPKAPTAGNPSPDDDESDHSVDSQQRRNDTGEPESDDEDAGPQALQHLGTIEVRTPPPRFSHATTGRDARRSKRKRKRSSKRKRKTKKKRTKRSGDDEDHATKKKKKKKRAHSPTPASSGTMIQRGGAKTGLDDDARWRSFRSR